MTKALLPQTFIAFHSAALSFNGITPFASVIVLDILNLSAKHTNVQKLVMTAFIADLKAYGVLWQCADVAWR